jgi:hypothetical protein
LILQEKYLPRGLFSLWKVIFSVYGRHVARRVWQRIRDEDPGLSDKRIPLRDLEFAFERALKDHGRNVLSEETLMSFDEELREKRSARDNPVRDSETY